jgi:hypothetical protein
MLALLPIFLCLVLQAACLAGLSQQYDDTAPGM